VSTLQEPHPSLFPSQDQSWPHVPVLELNHKTGNKEEERTFNVWARGQYTVSRRGKVQCLVCQLKLLCHASKGRHMTKACLTPYMFFSSLLFPKWERMTRLMGVLFVHVSVTSCKAVMHVDNLDREMQNERSSKGLVPYFLPAQRSNVMIQQSAQIKPSLFCISYRWLQDWERCLRHSQDLLHQPHHHSGDNLIFN
jgi:hypothetical protein